MESPLPRLTDHFIDQRNKLEPLALGSDINESVQKHFASNLPFSSEDVCSLVAAIDVNDNAICRRLDGPGATILCSIFLQSESCLAKHRGLYLLAASIHPSPSDTEDSTVNKAARKLELAVSLSALCREILESNDLHTSRWAAVLALELVTDHKTNTKKMLRGSPRILLGLGDVLKISGCASLRQVTASLIRHLVCHGDGVCLALFFPEAEEKIVSQYFPLSEQHDFVWIRTFETDMAKYLISGREPADVAQTVFACALAFGSHFIDLDEAVMLVSLEERHLSIVIPTTEHSFAIYIDVPLNNIDAVRLAESFSQVGKHALQIEFASQEGIGFYVNSAAEEENHLLLGFDSYDNCSTLKAALERRVQAMAAELHSLQRVPSEEHVAELDGMHTSNLDPQGVLPFLWIQQTENLDVSKHLRGPAKAQSLRSTNPSNMQQKTTVIGLEDELQLHPRMTNHEDRLGTHAVQREPETSVNHEKTAAEKIPFESGNTLAPKSLIAKEQSDVSDRAIDMLSQRDHRSQQLDGNLAPMPVQIVARSVQPFGSTNGKVRGLAVRDIKMITATSKGPETSGLGVNGEIAGQNDTEARSGPRQNEISYSSLLPHGNKANSQAGPRAAAKPAAKPAELDRKADITRSQAPAIVISTLHLDAGALGLSAVRRPPATGKVVPKAERINNKLVLADDDLWDPEKQVDEEGAPEPRKQSNQGKKRVAKTQGRKILGRLAKSKANKKMEDQLVLEESDDEILNKNMIKRKDLPEQPQFAKQSSGGANLVGTVSSNDEEAEALAASPHLEDLTTLEMANETDSTEAAISNQLRSVQQAAKSALKAMRNNGEVSVDEVCSDPPRNDDAEAAPTNVIEDVVVPSNPEDQFVPDSLPLVDAATALPQEMTIAASDHDSQGLIDRANEKPLEASDTHINLMREKMSSSSQAKPSLLDRHTEGKIPKSGSTDIVTTRENAIKATPAARVIKDQDPVAARLHSILDQPSTMIGTKGISNTSNRLHRVANAIHPSSPASGAQAMSITAKSATNIKKDSKVAPVPNKKVLLTPKNTKRKAEQPRKEPSKRSKILTPKKYGGNMNIKGDGSGQQAPLAIPERKTPMIHFMPSGPQNQGTVTNSGPRKAFLSRPTEGRILPRPGTVQIAASRSEERLGSQLAEPTPKAVPSHTEAIPLVSRPTLIPLTRGERSLPSGSQRKITEDGSPIILSQSGQVLTKFEPFIHNDGNGEASAQLQVDDDGDYYMQHDAIIPRFDVENPTETMRHHVEFPHLMSQKQQPSSPLAPSTHANLPAHYLQSNGKILNTKTKEAVVPVQPQNPFAADSKPRNSSFIDKLRKSVNYTAQEQNQSTSKPATGPDTSLGHIYDDETTLIEPSRPRKRRKPRKQQIEISSSESSTENEHSSCSSRSEASTSAPPGGSSPFEPHQEDLYLLMCGIVKRLVQHQAKQEDEFQNLVDDYRHGGQWLIQQFIDHIQQNWKAKREAADKAEGKLASMYQQSLHRISKIGEAKRNVDLKKLKAEWEDEQKRIIEAGNEALKLCET